MEPTTTKTEAAQTDGTTATAEPTTPTQERLASIRELAATNPAAAQQETWDWFKQAGKRARSDRDASIAELNELFRSGNPSQGLDGPTEGILVTFTLQSQFDSAIAAITSGWMPWAGKRFDAAVGGGDNLIARSAKWPARLLWPLYGMREDEDPENLTAFDFTTRVEPGADDPDIDVLVIDYAPVDSNPRLIIKSIRDELVEVAPGAHLGKMLWRRGSGPDAKYSLLAFFALKSPLPA